MLQAERFRLHGRYRTPQFKYGAVVEDLSRGRVQIVGLSDGRIPWPIGKKGSAKSLVLFKGLAKAVLRESHQAVRHWWGVGGNTVWRWRKALGVPAINEGIHRLKVRYAKEPFFTRAQRKAWSKARDPERRAKIAAAKLGKPRPPEVVAKIGAANRGTRHTDETRRKMGLAHKRCGSWPPAAGRPWTKQEDALIRALRPQEVKERTGRTLDAIWSRRRLLGLPDGRAVRKLPMSLPGRWTSEQDALVRKLRPREAVDRLGRTMAAVLTRRRQLGVPDGRVNNGRPSRKMG
jgi:hypothetical protein